MHRKVICLALVAAWCAVPAVGFAGKCSGTNINNLVSWEPTEIGKGTPLAIMRITNVTVSDDPGAACHLISGECVGRFPQWEFTQLQGEMAAVRWVGSCQ